MVLGLGLRFTRRGTTLDADPRSWGTPPILMNFFLHFFPAIQPLSPSAQVGGLDPYGLRGVFSRPFYGA